LAPVTTATGLLLFPLDMIALPPAITAAIAQTLVMNCMLFY
jgi:hypothetical protein